MRRLVLIWWLFFPLSALAESGAPSVSLPATLTAAEWAPLRVGTALTRHPVFGRLTAAAARAGAQLVVLPENFSCMPTSDMDRLAIAEADGAGPAQDFPAQQARMHKLWLLGGTLPIRAPTPGKVRAACLLFDDQ